MWRRHDPTYTTHESRLGELLSLTSTPQMQIGREYKDARGTNFGIFILIWVLANVFISYDKGKSVKINKPVYIVNIACIYIRVHNFT